VISAILLENTVIMKMKPPMVLIGKPKKSTGRLQPKCWDGDDSRLKMAHSGMRAPSVPESYTRRKGKITPMLMNQESNSSDKPPSAATAYLLLTLYGPDGHPVGMEYVSSNSLTLEKEKMKCYYCGHKCSYTIAATCNDGYEVVEFGTID
jgi:hypothetical protein